MVRSLNFVLATMKSWKKPLSYFYNYQMVENKGHVKDLGVFMNSNATFTYHIHNTRNGQD